MNYLPYLRFLLLMNVLLIELVDGSNCAFAGDRFCDTYADFIINYSRFILSRSTDYIHRCKKE